MFDYTFDILKVLHNHGDFVNTDVIVAALIEKYPTQTPKNIADKIIELQKSGCIKPFNGVKLSSDFLTKYYFADRFNRHVAVINVETTEKGKQLYLTLSKERNAIAQPTPTPLTPLMDLDTEILKYLQTNGRSDTDAIIDNLISRDPKLTARDITSKILYLQYEEPGFINPLLTSGEMDLCGKYLIHTEIDYSINVSVEISHKGRKHLLELYNLQNPAPKNETNNYFGGVIGNLNTGNIDGSLAQTYSPPTEKKEAKKSFPKWLTLSFYWEEIVKYKFRLLFVAIAATVSTWIGFYASTDKKLDKQLPAQDNSQQFLPSDTQSNVGTSAQYNKSSGLSHDTVGTSRKTMEEGKNAGHKADTIKSKK